MGGSWCHELRDPQEDDPQEDDLQHDLGCDLYDLAGCCTLASHGCRMSPGRMQVVAAES